MYCYFTAYLKRSHQELFNGVLFVKKFGVLKKIKLTEVYRGEAPYGLHVQDHMWSLRTPTKNQCKVILPGVEGKF
jgi:hypothetical protein